MIRIIAAAAFMLGLAFLPAGALEKSVVLSVENATCELCGPIVEMALGQVPGVKKVKVSEDYALSPPVTAEVVFDDAVTNLDALVEATTNAGYPSYPASQEN